MVNRLLIIGRTDDGKISFTWIAILNGRLRRHFSRGVCLASSGGGRCAVENVSARDS